MRELPEPKIEVKLPNMLDGDIEVIESFTRYQVLAIQKQAYEDGLRDALENPVHQFRAKHCSDWYDGHPDHEDGGGPYESRTLYAPKEAK